MRQFLDVITTGAGGGKVKRRKKQSLVHCLGNVRVVDIHSYMFQTYLYMSCLRKNDFKNVLDASSRPYAPNKTAKA